MIKAGSEFGELQGQYLIVEWGVGGLRPQNRMFNAYLSAHLRHLGFVPTKANLDLYGSKYQKMDPTNKLRPMLMMLLS
jgi:hypothetical protein